MARGKERSSLVTFWIFNENVCVNYGTGTLLQPEDILDTALPWRTSGQLQVQRLPAHNVCHHRGPVSTSHRSTTQQLHTSRQRLQHQHCRRVSDGGSDDDDDDGNTNGKEREEENQVEQDEDDGNCEKGRSRRDEKQKTITKRRFS